jgi:tripartite-type tricarboxylate transporter receptor subunit TctC
MKTNIYGILALLILCGTVLACSPKDGKESYPSKDLQFIVGANAGGGTDAICRKIAQLAERELGASFFLINKPGASDAVGPNVLMGAKPDGYTIGNVNRGAVVDAVYQNLIAGYDLSKLQFVALVTEESDAIMVRKDTPYKTFDDLIKAAKANPGKIRIGDQGIGSRVNLLLRRVEAKYGVEFNKISYTSSAPQREAIINREIEGAVTSLGDFAALLQSGGVRGLIEFSDSRNPAYPNIPTVIELGLGEDFLCGSFVSIAVPRGTAADKVQILETAFQKAVTSREFHEWAVLIGVTPRFMAGTELDAFVRNVQAKDFAALDDLKKKESR